MNLSRESVIICEPSPSVCKINGSRKETKKKTNTNGERLTKEKVALRTPLRIEEYESPLKYLRINGRKRSLSSSISDIIIIDSPDIKKGKKQVKKTRKRLISMSAPSEDSAVLQDSVIVISDSEIESSKDDKITHSRGRILPLLEKAPDILESDSDDLIVVESSNATTKHTSNTKPVPRTSFYRTRASVKKMKEEMSKKNSQKILQENLLDSNQGQIFDRVSNLHLQEESAPLEIRIEEENIEPKEAPQRSEEIAVIWASDKNTCLTTKSMNESETCNTSNISVISENQPNSSDTSNSKATKSIKVIIDPRPSPRNLKSITSNLHTLNTRSKKISRRARLRAAGKSPMKGKKKMKCLQDIVLQTSMPSNNQSSTLTENAPINLENKPPGSLREIIIDGSNVAFAHTAGKSFSTKGLQLVIDYFKDRGHTVKAFIPHHRRSPCNKILEQLYREGIVIFTPSRTVCGKMIVPYDDRYILEYATKCQGIVVSHDRYRDLYNEKPGWKDTIDKRLLEPTFVGDYVMFPDDPLGRWGPSLNDFLRH